jgi:adenylate cyclase
MDESRLAELAGWIAKAALSGAAETTMLAGFCERALAAGLPLAGGLIVV